MIVRADVHRLPLADNSIDMIFADPPYVAAGIHTYKWLADEAMRILKPGCFVAAMCGGYRINEIMRWFDDAGLTFYWLYQLGLTGNQTGHVWIRGNNKVSIITRTKHILTYSKGDGLSRTGTLGLFYNDRPDKNHHHWGQGIESHRYYIDCFSKRGDLVLDPFCGGGTTAVACQVLDRRWLCMDLDPAAIATTAARIAGNGPTTRYPLFDHAEAT